MEIEVLRSFIAVAESLSFTKASKLLYVSQPRLSAQISSLEKEVGAQLFLRDTRSVALTAAGRVFYTDAVQVYDGYQRAIANAALAVKGKGGSLRILFSDYFCAHHLLDPIEAFKRERPDVNVDLRYASSPNFTAALMGGDADVGITPAIAIESEPALDRLILCRERHCLAVNCNSPLAKRSSVTISELQDESFITPDEATLPFAVELHKRMFAKREIRTNIVREVADTGALLFLVEAGVGVAFLPKNFAMKYRSAHLRFIDVDDSDSGGDVVLAWKKELTDPSAASFIKLAGEHSQ